jgi:hypothetical protein
MRTIPSVFLMFLTLASHASTSNPPLYLRCTLVATGDAPANQIDFTLNEANGTVAVKGLGLTSSTTQAIFGPDYVTWSVDLGHDSSLERSINRTDLSFTETMNLMGDRTTQTGSCKVIHPPKRQI